jgi:hypothetical protein
LNNSLLIRFKNLSEGWKFFGAVVGFGSIISLTAIKVDHWKDKGITQENIIEYLQKAEHDQKLYNRMNDSLDILWKSSLLKRLNGISDTNYLIIEKQEKVIKSVDAIASKVAGSIEEYKSVMNGLQFELIQPEAVKSVFGKASIRIMPIPKDSIK